jgi:uncharacterized protein
LILYLDTSALVKAYVAETSSDSVRSWITRAGEVATVSIAYAEARAAFARHAREGRLAKPDLRLVVNRLDDDWSRYTIVETTDGIVAKAGALAERHALRGFDAIHLAAALELRSTDTTVDFACFDARLNRAARRERLRLPAV